jgi:hypothetical protein
MQRIMRDNMTDTDSNIKAHESIRGMVENHSLHCSTSETMKKQKQGVFSSMIEMSRILTRGTGKLDG